MKRTDKRNSQLKRILLQKGALLLLGGVLLAFYPLFNMHGGLDGPTAIGKYLNGNLPSQNPNLVVQDFDWEFVPAFPNLSFRDPIALVQAPNSNNFYLGLREGKVYRFENNEAVSDSELFLDISERVATNKSNGFWSLAFHPEFGDPNSPNRLYFYVYYNVQEVGAVNPSSGWIRLSRFSVDPTTNLADPTSELLLINMRWTGNTHRGKSVIFGDDGFLYLSIGDLVDPEQAQAIDQKFNSGVLRIDVDKDPTKSHEPKRFIQDVTGNADEVSGLSYWIPDDNPFVEEGNGVFEEYFALGLRQPFKLSKDKLNGQMWIGEIGATLTDEINLLAPGANFQWPYTEGINGAGQLSKPANPIGIETPPLLTFDREDVRSLIGGFVYRGTEFPGFYGKYICGDHETNKIFAISIDSTDQSVSSEQISAFSPLKLVNISEDNNGNLYFMGLGETTVYKLKGRTPFTQTLPSLLSETGAFKDVTTLELADGFIPYEPIQSFYSDGAEKFRAIALPNDGNTFLSEEKIKFSENGEWEFPIGTVFLKHFELPIDDTQPGLTKRLETRFFVRAEDGTFYGLTYKWNATGTDATLLSQAEDETFTISTSTGSRSQIWHFPSYNECASCHTNGAGTVLGLKTRHLNKQIFYPSTNRTANQLATLSTIGAFDTLLDVDELPGLLTASDISNDVASLEDRARSYFDINCSQCHRPETNNQAEFDMRMSTSLEEQSLIYGSVLENLGILGARAIFPKDTSKSIVYKRLNTNDDCCRMEPIARRTTDTAAVSLIAAWINSLDEEGVIPGVDRTLIATDDAYVRPSEPNNNYGSKRFLNLKNNGTYSQYAYIKFDSDFPVIVDNATLRLFPLGSSAIIKIGIYETGTNWDESSITAANAPNVGSLLQQIDMINNSDPIEIDVSTYVRNALSSGNEVAFHIRSDDPSIDFGLLGTKEELLPAELILTPNSSASNQSPVASFTAGPTIGDGPLTVNVDASTSSDPDGFIASYFWNFGDGQTGNGQSTSHIYTLPGSYTCTLTVTDNEGKTSEISTNILVTGENSGTTSSFEAIEDAYVKAADQNGNFGAVNELRLKNNGNFSHVTFIKFDVGQLEAVTQATLRLFPSSSSKLVSVGVFETGSSWTEAGLTAGNAPSAGSLLGELSMQNVSDPLELDVSAYAAAILSSQSTIAFRIESTNPNKDVGLLSSRESGSPAELVLQSGGSNVNQSPLAAIGTDVVSGPAPLLVGFTGIDSNDPDGTIESYAWDFGDGGTSKLPQTAHPFNTAGTYLVSLVVADDEGAKDTAEVTITVTEPVPNTAPTASFMADPVSGTVPLTVNLDASASSDSDGTIATYAWDLGDGNTGSGNPASHTFTSVGIFNVQLIVTDNEGAKDTTNQEITVNEESGPVNVPPTATFTADPLPGTAPLVVNFDATASSDSDGTITSYTWDFGDGNTGSGNASSHSFSNAGTYTVILTVTDNEGATGTSSQSITVNEDSGPGTTTILTAIDDAYIRLNKGNNNYGSTGFMNLKNNGNYSHESYIKFDAGATQGVNNALLRLFPSPGTEQVIIEVYGSSSNWNEGSITANNAPGSQTLIISHTMTSTSATIELDVGAYVQNTLANEPEVSFHLVSGNPNKDIGQIGTKEGGLPAELVIETGSGPGPSNVPPVAEILAVPTNGEAPLTVSLDGSGSSDIDGTIATYAWDFGDGNTGSGAITSHEYLNPGIFTATLRVTDDQGASGTATESITVTAPIGNLPPTALFSYDPPSGIVPLNVNFDGSASSDSDGSIASYEWVFGDGTTGSGEAISHQYTTVGSFTVELTVTDDQGATTSASHAVTVNEVGGPSTTVTLGAIEDSYVKLAKANSNYGSAQEMRLKDNGSFSFQGYIKFDAGSPQQVSTATLRMYPKSGTSLISVGVNASSDGWFESSIVGSNAPASQGTLGDLDISSSNDPLELDVTSYVAGILSTQASIAFQIVSTNGNKDIGLIGTKEGGLGAELVLEVGQVSNSEGRFGVKTDISPYAPITVYPNPFERVLFVELPEKLDGHIQIQLTNLLGEHVQTWDFPQQNTKIKLAIDHPIAEGFYFLEIHSEAIHTRIKLVRRQ